jgi:periplasmic copper chaperone A
MKKSLLGLLLGAITAHATAAGHLVIENAWIRAAPPGSMMLAGYATLHNDGDAPLVVTGADSADFADVSLHQTIDDNGVEKMRPLPQLEIVAGARVELAPGGRHLMLMQPQHELKEGDAATIRLKTAAGNGASAKFVVRSAAPDH